MPDPPAVTDQLLDLCRQVAPWKGRGRCLVCGTTDAERALISLLESECLGAGNPMLDGCACPLCKASSVGRWRLKRLQAWFLNLVEACEHLGDVDLPPASFGT